MDISEAESGAMLLRREVVPLSDVATRAVDLYRDVADAREVGLHLEAAPDVCVACEVMPWLPGQPLHLRAFPLAPAVRCC